MNETLRHLKDLQTVDTELLAARRRQKAGPAALAREEGALQSVRAECEAKHAELMRERAEADQSELQLKSCEQEIESLKEKMRTIKNNKEYQALKGQIDEVTRRKGAMESVALQRLDRVDAIQQSHEAVLARVREAEESVARVAAEIEAEAAEIQTQVDAIRTRRKEQADRIEAEFLSLYERVIRSGGGVAVIGTVSGACQGCFLTQSPNAQNKILAGQEIVRCEGCGRFLLPPEETTA